MEGFHICEAAIGGERGGKFERLLKIVAVLDQLHALGQHGAILLLAVAVRDDNDRLQAEQPCGHADALAMIAASGRHHALEGRFGLLEPVHINQRAAQLECAYGGLVLVLDPGFSREAFIDQRPGVLRRGRHVAIDHCLSLVNLG